MVFGCVKQNLDRWEAAAIRITGFREKLARALGIERERLPAGEEAVRPFLAQAQKVLDESRPSRNPDGE